MKKVNSPISQKSSIENLKNKESAKDLLKKTTSIKKHVSKIPANVSDSNKPPIAPPENSLNQHEISKKKSREKYGFAPLNSSSNQQESSKNQVHFETDDNYTNGQVVGAFVVGSEQNLAKISRNDSITKITDLSNTKNLTFFQKIKRKFRRLAADDLTGQSLWSLPGLPETSEFPEIDLNQENLRGHWGKRIEFLLSCIGYAVGLGNIWRFPFKCYEGGGGAFLIPYFIMLIIAALPIFFMELSFGQFASLGPISIWNVCPALRGIGISMVIICAYVCLYYNVIIAWSFMYLFKAFYQPMPWQNCNNVWNDESCASLSGNNASMASGNNTSINSSRTFETSADQYWNRFVLKRITSRGELVKMQDGFGLPGWEMFLCLLLAWVLILAILSYGIKSVGKVVYFTATFPYLIIVIMIGIGATLPGSRQGVSFYMSPNWSKLIEIKTWKLAAEQIFYSVGIGFGSLITMSSYNGFHDNCHRDCIIVASINSFTSVLAGFAVFEVIGYMARQTQQHISEVGMSGAGLIFIAYPEGLSGIRASNFLTILLFLMVITLGIDSQIAMLETVITGVTDQFSHLFNTRKRRMLFVAVICFLMFLFDIFLITPQGIYYFTILDGMSSSFSLMIVTIFEIIAITYIYGFQKFTEDIYMMLKYKVPCYWIVCWLVVSPLAILFIFGFSIYANAALSYGIKPYNHIFPPWAQVIGWLICITAFISIPIYAIYFFIISKKQNPKLNTLELIKFIFRENDEWGPMMKSDWLESKRYRDKIRRIQMERKAVFQELEHDLEI